MIAAALPQLEFRQAEDTVHDSSQFCQLSNSLYARPVDSAYYSWQFFQTPFPSLTTVAVTSDGELCGSYTLHVQPSLPENVSVAWVVDIMVSPQYQRQGIFRRLTEYAIQQVQQFNPVALCVMANEKADRACVEGLGWQRVNIFNTWLLKHSASDDGKRTLSYKLLNNFELCGELLDSREGISSERAGLFSNQRSVSYLNWRFVQNPRYSYARFLVETPSGAFGYLVLKIFHDPTSKKSFGDIVDMYWLEDDIEALRDMLLFALNWFKNSGVEEIAMWRQTNTVLDRVGMDLGFSLYSQPRYFCCNVLDPRYSWLKEPDRWFITMADSEVY